MSIALSWQDLFQHRLRSAGRDLARALVARSDQSISLFGPGCALALLAGCTGCLLLPIALPWLLSICLLVAGFWLAWRGGHLRLLGMLLVGLGFTGLHTSHALAMQLPLALENKVLTVSGRIDDLPVHESRRTRFEFVVDADDAQPAALRGTHLRLGWFDDDLRAREILRAGSRWRQP
ncbi:MAG: DNA internalization-related competence protein ComEC/Rec2, partial [Thermomonas sp.]